jgi:hypothetical protein
MFDHQHYVPALKWRMGEYRALQNLTDQSKAQLTPLVEITPIPWNFQTDQPDRSVDEHLASVPEQMSAAWGTQRDLFVELGLLEPQERMSSGAHPLEALFDAGAARGLRLIPVTGPGRDPAYQAAVRSVIERLRVEVCIRLDREDFLSPDCATRITDVLAAVGSDPARAHLVLDVFAVDQSQISLLMAILPAVVAGLPNLADWQSFTLLSGAFPVNLSDVVPGLGHILRVDWTLWQQLTALNLRRTPTFGDYGIAHPAPGEEIDPRFMHVSASIRYTASHEWLIFRGRDVRHPAHGGFTQFRSLSAQVVAHAAYSGPTFSWADAYISECAAGTASTGNHTTWRRVGTNHHLAYVVSQIANHFAT